MAPYLVATGLRGGRAAAGRPRRRLRSGGARRSGRWVAAVARPPAGGDTPRAPPLRARRPGPASVTAATAPAPGNGARPRQQRVKARRAAERGDGPGALRSAAGEAAGARLRQHNASCAPAGRSAVVWAGAATEVNDRCSQTRTGSYGGRSAAPALP